MIVSIKFITHKRATQKNEDVMFIFSADFKKQRHKQRHKNYDNIFLNDSIRRKDSTMYVRAKMWKNQQKRAEKSHSQMSTWLFEAYCFRHH